MATNGEVWEVTIGYRGELVTVRVAATQWSCADVARRTVSRERDWPLSELVMLHGREVRTATKN